MLYLNKKTINTIDRNLIQNAVGKAYKLVLTRDYTMPDRMHVQDKDNTLLLMPCFSGPYFATKLVSVFPGAVRENMPAVNGVMVLADNRTGQPLAIMDGAAVTAERTGAVGGLGVSLLTAPDLETAGIFGAGVQGFSQVRYLLLNRSVKRLMIFDIFANAARAMAEALTNEFPDVAFAVADSPIALVKASDLVIAATTSHDPLFEADPELVRGKTFISIGSFRPDMKEFPDAVITEADHIYADTPFAAEESGDICIPLKKGLVQKDQVKAFADVIKAPVILEKRGKVPKTLFFKSTGMALFDLTVASALYELANQNDLGQLLDW